MQEKRKFVRLGLTLKVAWKRISADGEYTDGTKDLSAGGICLIVDEEMSVGDLLGLRITLPSGKMVSCQARVVRVRNFDVLPKTNSRYEVGVAFTEIGDAERQAIEQYVFSMFRVSV